MITRQDILSLADQHQRYGVALISAKRTRVLEAFMGRIAEHDDLPGLEATNASTNAKQVAAALEALTRRQGLQRLILIAPPKPSSTWSTSSSSGPSTEAARWSSSSTPRRSITRAASAPRWKTRDASSL